MNPLNFPSCQQSRYTGHISQFIVGVSIVKTKQLAGTFTYDKCTGKLRLNHVDGSPVKSIGINLVGDNDSYVDAPCRRVVLFASQDGVFNLATAQRAPIDWQCHPGKRLAQLLAVFAPVSRLIEWIFSRCQRPQNQSAQNGNKHANYNHPKGAAFVITRKVLRSCQSFDCTGACAAVMLCVVGLSFRCWAWLCGSPTTVLPASSNCARNSSI